MAKVVWKFPLQRLLFGPPDVTVQCPAGARVVMVGMQFGLVTLWMECEIPETANPLAVHPTEDRRFLVAGTGRTVPDKAVHVGSTIDNQFVWHVYEVPL